MKKVKQYATVAIMVMAGLELSAQEIGIRAGYTQFTPDFDGEKIDQFSDPKSTFGFHIGPTLTLNFSEMVALETGLLFYNKGYEYQQIEFDDFLGTMYTRNGKTSLYGVTLPITFKLAVEVFKNVKIVGVAGNYIALGLTGTAKGTETTEQETRTFDEPYWDSRVAGLFQKFDTGFMFGAGVEIGQVELRASYEMGLIDIAKEAYTNLEVYNQSLNISIGYRFKNKK